MQTRSLLAVVVVLAVLLFSAAHAQNFEKVVGRVISSAGYTIQGTITFSRAVAGVDPTVVTVNMTGFNVNTSSSSVGIHIHTWGDLSDIYGTGGTGTFTYLGPHWDPTNTYTHACPENTSVPHHAGDLGNWDVVNGAISQSKDITGLSFSGATSIVGRGVIIHNTTDNCQNVSIPANTRAAAAILGIASGVNNSASAPPGAPAGFAWLQRTTAAQTPRQYYSDETGVVVCTGCGAAASIVPSSTDTSLPALIQAVVTNIDSNDNGFHIHTYGDVSDPFTGAAAGGHWNPNGAAHGLPSDLEREVGDLGYFRQSMDDPSTLVYRALNPLLAGNAISTVIGRAFMVHLDTDHGSALDSNTSTPLNCSQAAGTAWAGAAGARILMGVIGLAQTTGNAVKPPAMTTELTNANLASFEPSSCNLAKANNNGAGVLAVPALFLLALIIAAMATIYA